MSASLLDIRGLVVDYGRTRAVRGVDIAVAAGEIVALVGESGSGKSTVLRAACGLTRATAGSAKLDGHELLGVAERTLRPLRRRMQIVFQDPYASLDPRMTAAAIVTEPLAIHEKGMTRGARRARALELLDEVGLPASAADRYPHEFSGGQRQRLGIARALALRPELVLLDEPVSALDVSVQAQILNLLADLRERRDLAYLMVTHDLSVVRHLADRVAVMRAGEIVEEGATARVLDAPAHPYTVTLRDAVPVWRLS